MAATRVCTDAELAPATAMKVVIDGKPIAVVKDSSGAVHALGDTCTHGDISLSEGFVEDDSLECWAHGSKFELATGKPKNFPAYEPVPVYAVTVENGEIFVDADQTLTT
ncbi:MULTISPECIES: non-heme iron oxygenase ferredoxin subunit [unclassified Microcella]|uniref:non-heme iron oxygenase ferredoxin subunit n=1 Tax=unclassified Microcella TaxID=2630066 RepID=UPI0006F5010E|nr:MULTISPECIES: non-heme iron oxygenase ferredoxin subunit [unclassified Microcella]KQV25049.1 non-heme iron oxygenase ferredoxin subunit [Yonghaparkia sp. Root332]KRF31335.1 non-heme iron oxygenase ferredoxin subunit [Yonghaparkia sp. Soil809]